MSIEVESLKVGEFGGVMWFYSLEQEGWRVWWCDVVLFFGVRRLESLVV